jgi:hypothetical protein
VSGIEQFQFYAQGGDDEIDASAATIHVNLDGGAGEDTVIGSNQASGWGQTIVGGADADTIVGNQGSDSLYGGESWWVWNGIDDGAGDKFVFGPNSGYDTIYDFVAGDNGSDVLDVSAYGFTSMSDLTITQSGTNTSVQFDGSNTVTLYGVSAATLNTDDFLFA